MEASRTEAMSEDFVARAWREGSAAFPGVSLTLAALRESVVEGTDWPHRAELFLAVACARGDRLAHEHLATLVGPVVHAVASRFAGRGPSADELRALLLERLLVPRPDGTVRVLSYDGMHALGAWTRVIALRLMLDHVPRTERTLESAVLDSLHAIDADPELLFQRSGDALLVRRVVEDACRALDARSRRMLRHALVEGLTVDEIGALYGVHRATAARQVRRALTTLVTNARAELGGPDGIALSRVDLSLERWLESTLHQARSA